MEATEAVALTQATANCSVPGLVAVAQERSIPARFAEAIHDRGSKTAMRWKHRGIWEAVSWAQYGAAVHESGRALIAFGLQRGERVAILSENRPEWLYVDLGAQSVGCVSVGIDPSEPAERVAEVLNDCGARVLF